MKLIRVIRCKKGSEYSLYEKDGDYFIGNIFGDKLLIPKEEGKELFKSKKPQRRVATLFNRRAFNIKTNESPREKGLRWLSCVNS